EATLSAFLRALNPGSAGLRPGSEKGAGETPVRPTDFSARQERTVREMERFTQRQLQLAHTAREQFLWSKIKPTTPEAWHTAMQPYREKAWNEMIGRFPV